MRILDTNVVSEIGRRNPDRKVIEFLTAQERHTTFITSITVFELCYGCAALPQGKRRTGLEAANSRVFDEQFEGRILGFGTEAARLCGTMLAGSLAKGNNLNLADVQIASIAMEHGYALVTRDTSHFNHPGLKVINPWTD